MVESIKHEYKDTFVFFGKKVVKHGDHFAVYIPNEVAKVLLEQYGGYVDVKVMAPSISPKNYYKKGEDA